MTVAPVRYLDMTAAPLREQLTTWRDAYPRMGVLALLPEAEKERLPLLQSICRELGLPLAGAIFPELVVDDRLTREGVWLLCLRQVPPAFLIPLPDGGAATAADAMAAVLGPALDDIGPRDPAPLLFMVFDAMVPNIGNILDSLYLRLADRVCYAGVNAGSETFQPMPCLFDDASVVGAGVLCLLLPDHPGMILAHGYPAPERIMTATATEGNRVISIDWRPAFEVYRELVAAEYGIALTRENFYQYGVHFPFGILRADQEVIVRIPVAITDDGSLFCVGDVPAHSVLALLKAPEGAAGNCIGDLAAGLAQRSGALGERPLLAFYCAGRRMHLGAAACAELAALKAATGATQTVGALSLGEIGSTTEWGYPLFHNATLVCAAWEGT